MAVHTGEAQLRDDGNYLGHALNRCARIRATGHGGQVLRSAATAALVADRLPAGADAGRSRRSIASRISDAPEHIWQLVHPDLPSSFPALRSLDPFRHNLPSSSHRSSAGSGEIAERRATCSAASGW